MKITTPLMIGLMSWAALSGCTDPDDDKQTNNGKTIIIFDDMSNADMNAEMSGDMARDMVAVDMRMDQADDSGEVLPPGCDSVGFAGNMTTGLRRAKSLSVESTTGGMPADNLSFYLFGDELQGGNFAFKDETFKDCTVCLVLQTGCQDGQCDATYLATEGNVNVVTTESTAIISVDSVRMTQVTIDDMLNSTKVQNGKTHCLLDPVSVSGPLTVDRCSEAPEATLADVTCGPAPLTVNFSAPIASFERVDRIRWDFGDGNIVRGEAKPMHVFQAGEWMVELVVEGLISGFPTTLTSPQRIVVY